MLLSLTTTCCSGLLRPISPPQVMAHHVHSAVMTPDLHQSAASLHRAARSPASMSAGGGVVPSADYKLAAVFLSFGLAVLFVPWLVGSLTLLLGILFLVQTARVRFVFDDEAFEVKAKEIDALFEDDSQLISSGENFAVGGENRWAYSSFVNWCAAASATGRHASTTASDAARLTTPGHHSLSLASTSF